MDWITEHALQIIVALSAAIAAYLNNRKKDKSGEPADYDGDGVPDNRPEARPMHGGQDPEEEDRTRRIQEEIRRKIAERRAGGGQQVPPPLVAPRPVASPLPEILTRRYETPAPKPAPPPLPSRAKALQAARDAEVLERQRALEEQMRELETRREQARRRAAEATAMTGNTVSGAVGSGARVGGESLLADLHNPESLRRAIVLREVLGTPVGLR